MGTNNLANLAGAPNPDYAPSNPAPSPVSSPLQGEGPTYLIPLPTGGEGQGEGALATRKARSRIIRANDRGERRVVRRRGKRDGDEPLPPEEGWVQWGGEAIWAVGETTGGAPDGLTREEFREAFARDMPGAGWARAKAILRRAIQERADAHAAVEVGWVKRIGRGLSRDIFAAEVEVAPDPGSLSGPYAVLLPRGDAIAGLDARTRREAEVLEHVSREARKGILGPGPVGRVFVVIMEECKKLQQITMNK